MKDKTYLSLIIPNFKRGKFFWKQSISLKTELYYVLGDNYNLQNKINKVTIRRVFQIRKKQSIWTQSDSDLEQGSGKHSVSV